MLEPVLAAAGAGAGNPNSFQRFHTAVQAGLTDSSTEDGVDRDALLTFSNELLDRWGFALGGHRQLSFQQEQQILDDQIGGVLVAGPGDQLQVRPQQLEVVQEGQQQQQQLQQRGQHRDQPYSKGGGSRKGRGHAWLADVELPCALLQQLEVQLSQQREQLLEGLMMGDGVGSRWRRGTQGGAMREAAPLDAGGDIAVGRGQDGRGLWYNTAGAQGVKDLAQQGADLLKQPLQQQQQREEEDGNGSLREALADGRAVAATAAAAGVAPPVAGISPGQLLDCCESMSTAALEVLKHIVPQNLTRKTSPAVMAESLTHWQQHVQPQQQNTVAKQSTPGVVGSHHQQQQSAKAWEGDDAQQYTHWLSACWLEQIRHGTVTDGLGGMQFSMKLLAAVTACDKFVKSHRSCSSAIKRLAARSSG